MKILHVSETLKGGIATYLNGLFTYEGVFQSKKTGISGVENWLIGPGDHAAYVPQLSEDRFIAFTRTSRSFGALIELAKVVRRSVAQIKPDVIIAHSSFAGLVVRALKMARVLPAEVVYCAHGWGFDREANRLVNLVIEVAERVLSLGCARIICISEHDYFAGQRIGLSKKKLVTIVNGVEDIQTGSASWPIKEATDSPRPFRGLFVGRFDRQKGFDILSKASVELKSRVQLCAVGGKVLEDDNLAMDYGNVQVVDWAEPDTVRQYMRAADFVIMPSRWEGFGLVAVEAYCVGKPVLAAKVGGLGELVKDGHTGLLFKPNSVSALVDAVEAIVSLNLDEMGSQARALYEARYTMERCAGEVFELCATLALPSR